MKRYAALSDEGKSTEKKNESELKIKAKDFKLNMMHSSHRKASNNYNIR